MRFADVLGRKNTKSILVEQADRGKLPHALLLWGQEGVGKLAMARALAQYIHCPNKHDGDSCGICPACRQHESMNFPDMHYAFPLPSTKGGKESVSADYLDIFHDFLTQYPLAPYQHWLEMSGAENSQPVIRVGESGEIIRRLNLGNYSSGMKILLLWLPEKLVPAAANKLLKLIEEPHPGRMFIMVSNNPALILPTVYSRLQRIKIEPPTIEETRQWLVHTGFSDSLAYQAASASGGNQLQAIRMLDENGEEAEFRSLFQELMRKAYMRDVKALRTWSEETAALKREKTRRFLTYMAHQIRQNYIFRLRNNSLTPMMDSDRIFSEKFSPFISGNNVEEILHLIDQATTDILGNANAKIVLFDFAMQMIMYIKKNS